MINEQIIGYIRHQLSQNVSREVITTNLKGSGWADADIAEAFKAILPAIVATPNPTPAPVSAPATNPVTNPATNPTTSYATNYSTPQTSNKSRKIFSIVLVLVLLCAAGGGAYAYYSGMFVSLPGLTKEALQKARATTSGSYDVTVSVDFSEIKDSVNLISSPLGSKKFSLTAKGSYDSSDSGNLKSSTVVSFNVDSSLIEIEARVLDNVAYASLIKLSGGSGLDLFLPNISSYENKWVSFPFEPKEDQAESNPLASLSGIDPSLVDKFTPEQKEHVYDLSSKASFIKTVERLSPETIGSELSYHFVFDLDREGIKSYLESLKAYVNEIGKNDSSLTAFDPTSFSKELDNVKDFRGEIWIGRNDKLIHKIVLNFGAQPDPAKAEQVKVTVVGIMSGWNEPVSIVAPAEHMSFKDFMAEILSGFSSSLQESNAKQGKEPEIKFPDVEY